MYNLRVYWLVAQIDPWIDDIPKTVSFEESWLDNNLISATAMIAKGQTQKASRNLKLIREEAFKNANADTALVSIGLERMANIWSFNGSPAIVSTTPYDAGLRWSILEQASISENLALEAQKLGPSPGAVRAKKWIDFITNKSISNVVLTGVRNGIHPSSAGVVDKHINRVKAFIAEAQNSYGSKMEGYIYRCIAELYGQAHAWQQATETLQLVYEKYEQQQDYLGQAACLLMYSDWMLAPLSSADIRNLHPYESGTVSSELSDHMENIEGAPPQEENIAQAYNFLLKAAELCQKSQKPECEAYIKLRQSYILALKNEISESCTLLTKATTLFAQSNNEFQKHLSDCLYILSNLQNGYFIKAQEVSSRIGAWGRTDGSFTHALLIGLIFTRFGRQALRRSGDYELCSSAYELSRILNEALGADFRVVQCYADLANVHRAIGNQKRAQSYRKFALKYLEQTKTAVQLDMPHRTWNIFLAQQHYVEALDQRDIVGMKDAVHILQNISTTSSNTDIELNAQFLQQSTLSYADLTIPLTEALLALESENPQQATKAFDEALVAAKSMPKSLAPLGQAAVYIAKDDIEAAKDIIKPLLSSGTLAMDDVKIVLRRISQSTPDLAQQEEQRTKLSRIETFFQLLARLGLHEHAYNIYNAELEPMGWPHENSSREQPWTNISFLAEVLEGIADKNNDTSLYQKALNLCDQAIQELESRRNRLNRDETKVAILGRRNIQQVYFLATRIAIKISKTTIDKQSISTTKNAVLNYSEQGRARSLRDLVTFSHIEPIQTNALAQWRKLTTQSQLLTQTINNSKLTDPLIEQNLQDLEQNILKEEQKLATLHPDTWNLITSNSNPIEIDDLCSQIPTDTVILNYMTKGEHLLLLGLTSSGMQHYEIKTYKASTLQQQVNKFWRLCAEGLNFDELIAVSKHLSQVLLKPFENLIKKSENIIVVPYGVLHRLSFAALRWDENWLGSQKTISYLPSTSIFMMLPKVNINHSTPVLAVANPDNMHSTGIEGKTLALQTLRYTEEEVKRISKYFQNTTSIVGTTASKEKLLNHLTKPKIIHMASHGIISHQSPLNSGIALANGEHLTVAELLSSQTQAELIVLSACSTALGQYTAGEEILGLTRALLAAGAKSTVVTLWPVLDNQTTVDLIDAFYSQLSNKISANKALQHAQKTIHQRATKLDSSACQVRDLRGRQLHPKPEEHPQNWASFIYIGRS